MNLSFSINYQTQWGQHIAVLYAADADIQSASPMQLDLECHGSAEWAAQVTLSDIHRYISYVYVVIDEQGNIIRRESMPHILECQPGSIILRDSSLTAKLLLQLKLLVTLPLRFMCLVSSVIRV